MWLITHPYEGTLYVAKCHSTSKEQGNLNVRQVIVDPEEEEFLGAITHTAATVICE